MTQNTTVINDILDRIDNLPFEDQILFQEKMKEKARRDIKKLLKEIGKENKDINYTEEEVLEDIQKVVKEVRANRAKKNKSSLRY